jgi:tetratricopeptide (TPR) repeat protein
LLQVGPAVVTSGTPQPVVETVEPKDLTILEQADGYLRQGQTTKAIATYREHMLNNGDDVFAMRRLGLALLAKGSVDEAAAMMGLAYKTDAPALAPQPMDAGLIPGGNKNFRKLLNKAVHHAHKAKTGSSWLLVAVLMQAEDRVEVAQKMIERARAAGLDEQIIREMTDALSL